MIYDASSKGLQMLFPTPVLRGLDQTVLDEIEQLHEHLRRQLSKKQTQRLRKFLTADAVAASNSIKGFRLSTVDVVDLMESERDVKACPTSPLQGHAEQGAGLMAELVAWLNLD